MPHLVLPGLDRRICLETMCFLFVFVFYRVFELPCLFCFVFFVFVQGLGACMFGLFFVVDLFTGFVNLLFGFLDLLISHSVLAPPVLLVPHVCWFPPFCWFPAPCVLVSPFCVGCPPLLLFPPQCRWFPQFVLVVFVWCWCPPF